ncbi:snRNA-activating protein complex subunit 4 [Ambystoma mexicanum]|uniref:snRNA-activating protein complex subunit 4 n=1 Tax=Ambystoma mexicanum TaxID=8296 RepID=UPI0037E8DCF9
MSVVDINAQREKIRKEIEVLEKSLDPEDVSIEVVVSASDPESDSESDVLEDEGSDASSVMEGEREEWKTDDEIDPNFPASPETCLQINLVYQEVIEEKIQEVILLLARNKERQEDILWQLAGPRVSKSKREDSLKAHIFIGRYMKPYFKDKATGCGPPANHDTREKAAQCIKSFQELHIAKWKTREKDMLKDSVLSDSLQRLLQPKLFKHEYLTQKLEKVKDEMNKQIVEKQIRETEREIEDINQLSEERLVGTRSDEHDWEKISNINFEGTRSAEELRKYWQNSIHPSINKDDWSEEEVHTLLEVATQHNCVDWQSIADELGTKRTPFQCLQKFQKYNKEFKKREWTKEEDQMLTHLVDQMRVGNHIPYQKIAYYMEGRDTFQLIYRWTKSVDPRLKKGPWTKEEDEKLLKAVSVYGERDWYKIREEVPGRSDSQCRDRYRKALNYRIKKGRWSQGEKKQLMKLIEKYGVGHWAKIASEMPNRTDSQCLHRWKMSIGARKYANRHLMKKETGDDECASSLEDSEDSFTSESSSEESHEFEIEFMDNSENEEVPSRVKKPTYSVAALDLWIPTREHTVGFRHKHSTEQIVSGSLQPFQRTSKGTIFKTIKPTGQTYVSTSSPFAAECSEPVTDVTPCPTTVLRSFTSSYLKDVTLEDPSQLLKEVADRGKFILRVKLADVRKTLRRNANAHRNKQKARVREFSSSKALAVPHILAAMSLEQVRGILQTAKEKQRRRPRFGFRKRNLDRNLLMAVTPWVGDVIVIYSMRAGSLLPSGTKADDIREKLQTVKLSSTPVFTLLLQLFKIDTEGCLQVIRERKVIHFDPPRAMPGRPPNPVQKSASLQSPPGCAVQSLPPKGIPVPAVTLPTTSITASIAEKPKGNVSSLGYRMHGPEFFSRPARAPKEKPKTVSELLREKRMKESNASSGMAPVQNAVPIQPKIVAPQSVVGQQPEQGSSVPQSVFSLQNSSSLQLGELAPSLPVLPQAKLSTSLMPLNLSTEAQQSEDGSASSHEINAVSSNSATLGKAQQVVTSSTASVSQTSSPTILATSLACPSLQNQAGVPIQAPGVLSVENQISETSTKDILGMSETKTLTPTPGTSLPIYTQQNLLTLLPAGLPSQGGPQSLTNKLMPFTLVVTPQGIVPVALQALLGVPGATQQEDVSKMGLNTAPDSPLPVASSSDNNIGKKADTNVTSTLAVPSSQEVALFSKSAKEGPLEAKSSSVSLPSTSTNTEGHLGKALPISTASSGCSNTTAPVISGKPCGASISQSSEPSSTSSSAKPSTASKIIPSAELLCSLSLISLSKGGPTAHEEPQSITKKRPLSPQSTDAVLQACKRSMTSVATTLPFTTKPEVIEPPTILHKSPVSIPVRNQAERPVCIPARKPIPARSPTVPHVQRPVRSQTVPSASIPVRGPTVPPVQLPMGNKNMAPVSIPVRGRRAPPLPIRVRGPSVQPVSIPVERQTVPTVPVPARSQTVAPVSIPMRGRRATPVPIRARAPSVQPVSIPARNQTVARAPISVPPVPRPAKSLNVHSVPIPVYSPAVPPVPGTDASQNRPPISSAARKTLDLSLVSLEEEGKVKSWLTGERGVQVPPLKDGLPYLPPSTCNLKTLSRLLRQKNVLESNATSLLASHDGDQERTADERLQAIQGLVTEKLKDNPAYLLLKSRFLSAFTLPAFLATLAPPRVRTTLRTKHFINGDTDDDEDSATYDEMDTTDEEFKEPEHRDVKPRNLLLEMTLDNTTDDIRASQREAIPSQDMCSEESCNPAAPESSVSIAETTTVQTRRSARLSKRL